MSTTPTTPTTRRVAGDGLATIAVAVFSISIVVGFARVFAGWSFMTDLVVIVVVGHGVSYGLRRLAVPGWLAVPALAGALAWLVAWIYYGSTFSWGLPNSSTWQIATLEIEVVREQFATTTAPVAYGAGWALLAALGVAGSVLLADTFAFRADASAETLVPGGVLFVFIGALGDDRSRIALTVVAVAAAYVAVVALRARSDAAHRPVVRAARGPVDLVVPAALGSALAVALVAGVIGPRIPGAGAEPLYETRGRSGGVTEVVSPLVDIRSRLVNQSDNELFRVSAPDESYWRVTTLPEFDGTTFRLPTRSLERIDGPFASSRPDAELLRQDIEIRSLGGQLVPAAADPVEATGDGLRWNPDTATLVNVDGDLTSGDVFTVVSATVRPQPSQLRSTTSQAPPDPVHLELPDDFPSSVRELAAVVTDDAPSDYDAAIALQTFFRTEFEYSLDVPAGHGASAIEVFLRQRVGYCEQFAATFAAMARSVGLASRVAVGYTAGLRTPEGPFSVLGRNAHAWPEIWFDGVGWIPFEPTPGRGAPGTEQYTGVAPAQDETPAAPAVADESGTPEPVLDTPPVVPDRPTDALEFDNDLGALFPDPSTGQGSDGVPARGPADRGALVQWLFVIVLMVLATVPAIGRRLVLRRREQAPAVECVVGAWRSATHSVTLAGVRLQPSMTTEQVAAATAAVLPVAARPMRSLGQTVAEVAFAPPGSIDLDRVGPYGETIGRNCSVWARQIDGIASDKLTFGQRVVRYVKFWE
jgi:transglutaminase-like putative cysteine protease